MTSLKPWTLPDSYFGPVYPGYYHAGFGRSRDSDTVEESNFQVASEKLLALATPEDETVIVVRDRHWAVGWIEYILIHQDNEAALELAEQLNAKVAGYPILDEFHFSDLENAREEEAWKHTSLKERIDLCVEAGMSILAARHDYPPHDDRGYIRERLLGY